MQQFWSNVLHDPLLLGAWIFVLLIFASPYLITGYLFLQIRKSSREEAQKIAKREKRDDITTIIGILLASSIAWILLNNGLAPEFSLGEKLFFTFLPSIFMFPLVCYSVIAPFFARKRLRELDRQDS